MKPNFTLFSFAFALLIATSTFAYGARVIPPAPPPPPATPPMESHNNVLDEELKYGPIGGAKSKPQIEVLAKCRVKYSKELEINAVWTSRFGRTGWWCTYKAKRT